MIKQPAMSPQEVSVAKLSPLNGSQMPHWKRFRARLPIVVTPARIVVAVLLLSRAHFGQSRCTLKERCRHCRAYRRGQSLLVRCCTRRIEIFQIIFLENPIDIRLQNFIASLATVR